MSDQKKDSIVTNKEEVTQTVHKKSITFYDGVEGSITIQEPPPIKDANYGYLKMLYDLYERVESLQKEVKQIRGRLNEVNNVIIPFGERKDQ